MDAWPFYVLAILGIIGGGIIKVIQSRRKK